MNVTQFGLRRLVARHGSWPLEVNLIIMVAAAWLAGPVRVVSAQGQTEVVALTGDPVADSEERFSPAFVAPFSAPVINQQGEVAFVGHSQAGGVGRGGGPVVGRIYRGRRGGLTRIYEGSVSSNIDLNDAGQVAFLTANTTAPAVMRGDGTTTIDVARAGQAVPGGTLSSFIGAPNITNDGGVSFVAGGGRRGGVYRGKGSTLEVIVESGQSLPGDGGTFVAFNSGVISLPAPSVNHSGRVSFWASASSNGEFYKGIFLSDGTSIARIARDSQTPPVGPDEFRNVEGQQPLVNDAGQVAFFASVSASPTFPPDGEVYLSDGATLTRIGGAASSVLGLNTAGQVLFVGLAEENRPGLLFGSESSLVSLTVQPESGGANWLEGAALNAAGQVGFLSSACGLCFYDEPLGVVQIAQVGESFLGSTIVDLGFRGSIGGEPGSLTDTEIARIAYSFTLADSRQGIAVWSLVPEPRSFVLMGLAMLGLSSARVRRRGHLAADGCG